MLATANPVPPLPSSRSARAFLAVFARHNVAYGELDCLPALMRELHGNKHFAMHFWSAVATMTDKQSAPPDEVLAAVVEAATGHTPAELRAFGAAPAASVDRVARLLSGQDVEAEAEQPPASRPAIVASPESGTEAPPEQAEAVLPVRGKAEPRVPSSSRRTSPPVTPAAATDASAAREENQRLVLMPERVPVAAAEPAPLTTLEATAPTADLRPLPTPLAGYAEATAGRTVHGAAVLAAVAAIVFAGGAYISFHSPGTSRLARLESSMHAGYASALAAWNSAPPPKAATTPASPAPPVQSARVPLSKPSAAIPRTSATAAPSVRTRPVAPSSVTRPDTTLTPSQKMAETAAVNGQAEASTNVPAAPAAAPGLVPVPEAAMNSQLFVSRVPVVPEDARAAGATGLVRMQATVNRNGYVTHLHVLDGPAELRRPALEAVSAWRYRPYVVNGQPVDVTTTVTVDFSSLRQAP